MVSYRSERTALLIISHLPKPNYKKKSETKDFKNIYVSIYSLKNIGYISNIYLELVEFLGQ